MPLTRRKVLRNGMLATIGALPVPVIAQSAASTPSSNPVVIRMRRAATDPGWNYVRVKSASRSYPPLPDEQPVKWSQYGGDAGTAWQSTGKFRVQQHDGRWWMVDPDGHPFLSCGINSIWPGSSAETLGAMNAKGGEGKWSESVVAWMRDHGFNTAGCWSNPNPRWQLGARHKGVAYTFYDFGMKSDPVVNGRRPHGLMECFAANLGVWKSAPSGKRRWPMFHPDFKAFCEERCAMLNQVKDDPWLVGYFSDNELAIPSLGQSLEAALDDPIYGGLASEARRWSEQHAGTSYVTAEAEVAWAAHVFDWYLSTTSTAIRERDGSHLLLGTRIFASERNFPDLFKVAGKYLDVVSLNPYGAPQLAPGRLQQWSKWAGNKPVLIGEFYVKGADVSPDGAGAGWTVATQAERGIFYEGYVLNLVESGVCVGWHWHQFCDVNNSNKGLFNAALDAHQELSLRVKSINNRIPVILARV